jgi:hypothetical protein
VKGRPSVRIRKGHEDWRLNCDAGHTIPPRAPQYDISAHDREGFEGGAVRVCAEHFAELADAIAARRRREGL